MDNIKLSKHEIQSGLSRVRAAEGLILQLPKDHDGRNTWLMNYGVREEAVAIRENDAQRLIDLGFEPRVLEWDGECDCLHSANHSPVSISKTEVEYFPIHPMSHPSTLGLKVPMKLMLEHEDQAQTNHGQSITRLAERGGCSPREIYAIIIGNRWKNVDRNASTDEDADKLVEGLVTIWRSGQFPEEPRRITVEVHDNRATVTGRNIKDIAAEADELGHAVIKPELTPEMKSNAAFALHLGMDFVTLFKGLIKMGRVKPGGGG